MRSYGQYCALARSLDLVGERWTLLIVRELFARESRYADLRDSLPGIASNLLAQRLRQLQDHGIIEAYQAPRPVRATVYRLTARGRGLGPVLRALVAWGAPLVADGQGDDAFRTHWMVLGLPTYFGATTVADLAPLTVLIRTGDEPATLAIEGDAVVMTAGSPHTEADDTVTVDGPADQVLAVLTGTGNPGGVQVRGPAPAVRRLHALAERCRPAET